MTDLPPAYAWLNDIVPPRMIVEGIKLYGIKEKPGATNAPEIMGWARTLDLDHDYHADAIPWCGLFVAYVCFKAEKPVVRAPLWARNWAKFGDVTPVPGLGDILVYARGSSGHVGFYIGEDAVAYHTLGGNQGDQVSIVRIPKLRLIAARRPHWKVLQPESVKPYWLSSGGDLSTNEG